MGFFHCANPQRWVLSLYWALPYLQMTLWSVMEERSLCLHKGYHYCVLSLACCLSWHSRNTAPRFKSGLNVSNMKLILTNIVKTVQLLHPDTPFAGVGAEIESPPPISCFLNSIWCFHLHSSQFFCLSLSQSLCIVKSPCIKKACWGFIAKSPLKLTSLSILLCTKKNIDFPAVSKTLLCDMRMKQIVSLPAVYYKWNCCE